MRTRQFAGDERGKPGIGHRFGGEVDLEVDISAGVLLGGQQTDRLVQYPMVDVLNHVEALGDVEEAARRDQVAVVADQSNQELVSRRAVIGQAEDWLGVEHETVLIDRLADPFGPGQLGLEPVVGALS